MNYCFTFDVEYLGRHMLDSNGPPIGNGLWEMDGHVTDERYVSDPLRSNS